MMTSEQRYLFDMTGYLHLKNVLNPEELHNAQEAADRYIQTSPMLCQQGLQLMREIIHTALRSIGR